MLLTGRLAVLCWTPVGVVADIWSNPRLNTEPFLSLFVRGGCFETPPSARSPLNAVQNGRARGGEVVICVIDFLTTVLLGRENNMEELLWLLG